VKSSAEQIYSFIHSFHMAAAASGVETEQSAHVVADVPAAILLLVMDQLE